MSVHTELRYKIEEFLLFGCEEEVEDLGEVEDASAFFSKSITFSFRDNVGEDSSAQLDDQNPKLKWVKLKEQCREFIDKVEEQSPEKSDLTDRIQKLKSQIDHLKKEGQEKQTIEQVKEYIRKKHQLQLLVLSRTMQQLESSSNIVEIPQLLLGVKESMPKVLVEGSKIKQLVQTVVQNVRIKLLKKFHEFFEEQLNEEVNAMDSFEDGGKSRTKMWEVFLRRSRDWLLAFAMVSILPYTLTQSSNYVLEKFQDALDEALTPIWGRFYHHLKMAREAQSANQIIWTFNYARSFIEMLVNLSSQITHSDKLKLLCDLNYFDAARTQILEKSLKFLRAHMAQILGDAIHDTKFLMHLIEEGIEFDVWMSSYGKLSGLCAILYESKEVFHRWLAQEQSLIYKQLEASLDDAFVLSFDSEIMDNKKSLRCYQGVYQSLTLFLQLRTRYQHFPSPAQLILSEVLLEPLLCFSLALLLYKIRSDEILYNISIANYNHILEDVTSFEKLRVFCDVVSYYQTALGAVEATTMIADSKRCKKRWTIIQNWMPKIFIATTQQQQGFSLIDLLRTAMKISDRYQSKTFEYRNEWHHTKDQVDSIHDCIIMARGLAITLVDVLERQLHTLSSTDSN